MVAFLVDTTEKKNMSFHNLLIFGASLRHIGAVAEALNTR